MKHIVSITPRPLEPSEDLPDGGVFWNAACASSPTWFQDLIKSKNPLLSVFVHAVHTQIDKINGVKWPSLYSSGDGELEVAFSTSPYEELPREIVDAIDEILDYALYSKTPPIVIDDARHILCLTPEEIERETENLISWEVLCTTPPDWFLEIPADSPLRKTYLDNIYLALVQICALATVRANPGSPVTLKFATRPPADELPREIIEGIDEILDRELYSKTPPVTGDGNDI